MELVEVGVEEVPWARGTDKEGEKGETRRSDIKEGDEGKASNVAEDLMGKLGAKDSTAAVDPKKSGSSSGDKDEEDSGEGLGKRDS